MLFCLLKQFLVTGKELEIEEENLLSWQWLQVCNSPPNGLICVVTCSSCCTCQLSSCLSIPNPQSTPMGGKNLGMGQCTHAAYWCSGYQLCVCFLRYRRCFFSTINKHFCWSSKLKHGHTMHMHTVPYIDVLSRLIQVANCLLLGNHTAVVKHCIEVANWPAMLLLSNIVLSIWLLLWNSSSIIEVYHL